MNFSDVTNLVGKMQKVQARRSFIPDKVLRTLNGEQGSAYPFFQFIVAGWYELK